MSRRRYAYTLGGVPLPEPMEVSDDYHGGDGKQPVFTDRYMEGTRSPVDGSDIGSRAKRAAHMKAHDLVDANDFRQEWAKKAAAREKFRRTGDNGADWGARFAATMQHMQRGGKR